MNSRSVAGFLLTCMLVALTACSDQGSDDSSKNAPVVEPADFVFTNGKVYTVDANNPWTEAVAVKGNKIVYVGDAIGAVEVTNPALQEAIDIEQLNLLVTDELHAAFNNPWCNDVHEPYSPDEGALRFVPENARAAFSKLPDQGYTLARPARAIHWKKDGQTYWIL